MGAREGVGPSRGARPSPPPHSLSTTTRTSTSPRLLGWGHTFRSVRRYGNNLSTLRLKTKQSFCGFVFHRDCLQTRILIYMYTVAMVVVHQYMPHISGCHGSGTPVHASHFWCHVTETRNLGNVCIVIDQVSILGFFLQIGTFQNGNHLFWLYQYLVQLQKEEKQQPPCAHLQI